MTIRNAPQRRGVVLLWVLVILAAIAVFSITITGDFVAARKVLDRRHDRFQAGQLADAGLEFAAMKLKNDKDYKGETLKLLPDGEVKVTVTIHNGKSSVTSEARYPLSSRNPVGVVMTRN